MSEPDHEKAIRLAGLGGRRAVRETLDDALDKERTDMPDLNEILKDIPPNLLDRALMNAARNMGYGQGEGSTDADRRRFMEAAEAVRKAYGWTPEQGWALQARVERKTRQLMAPWHALEEAKAKERTRGDFDVVIDQAGARIERES